MKSKLWNEAGRRSVPPVRRRGDRACGDELIEPYEYGPSIVAKCFHDEFEALTAFPATNLNHAEDLTARFIDPMWDASSGCDHGHPDG